MRIKFFGAASEVGRSCIMVESEGAKILLDAGVKIGVTDMYPLISDAEFREIDAVLISHAHLDHSAYLPHIFSTEYKNLVYATKPTIELINILAADYLKISNPQNISKDALTRMQRHYKIVEYHKEFKIKGLEVRFVPAGHILGSAMIEIKDRDHKLIYTGDVNFRSTRLLDAAYTEYLNADLLITESTYGGEKDLFPSERTTLNSMTSSIKETLNLGGKIVIPSFGVGRAQEILFILDDYMRSGILQTVPIYTDGMVNKAMRIHRHNVIYCRDELQKRILLNDDDPFKSKNFVPVTTAQQRRGIIRGDEACIIVTTSGMVTGGPILKYLEGLAGSDRNKLIMVGFQAEGTKGRELADGAKRIKIGNRNVDVNIKVEQYRLSAHADRHQLLHFIGKIRNLKEIFIIHGEQVKSKELANALARKYRVRVPLPGEEFTV